MAMHAWCHTAICINIVLYYIGCAALIRMDRGTENGLIGTTHITFRSQHTDDLSGANSKILQPVYSVEYMSTVT